MIEAIGWTGSSAFVGSYILVSFGYIAGDGYLFQFLNLAGGLFLGVNLYATHNMPVLTLELVWCFISLSAITRRFLKSRWC